MKSTGTELILFSVAPLFHGIVAVQLIIKFFSLNLQANWLILTEISIGISLVLSVISFVKVPQPRLRWIYYGIKLLVLLIVGYPYGGYIGVKLTLLCALVFETAVVESGWRSMVIPLGFICLAVVNKNPFYIIIDGIPIFDWGEGLQALEMADLLYLATYSTIILLLGKALVYWEYLAQQKEKTIEKLIQGGSHLAESNIELQKKVIEIERDAIFAERQRVIRDIHDIIGHALTKVILMMKAAQSLGSDRKEQISLILAETQDQAQKGMNEIREALKILHTKPLIKIKLFSALTRLVRAFDKTHINISIEYGNSPKEFNDEINYIIYRFVQEGITNAIRHGNADRISVWFWSSDKEITTTIQDNGGGSKGFKPDIGMKGIGERVSKFDGSFKAENIQDGFRLSVTIPWSSSDLE